MDKGGNLPADTPRDGSQMEGRDGTLKEGKMNVGVTAMLPCYRAGGLFLTRQQTRSIDTLSG
jgi:hypothetical protein